MAYLLHNHRPFCTHTACVAGLQTQDAIEAAIGQRICCGYPTLREARRVVAKVNRTDFAGYFSVKAGACPESVR
jgi:hypothetical protein